jgi:FkbM family methyltransferase
MAILKRLLDEGLPPFTILELGALPTLKPERFCELTQTVPGTQIISVEANGDACEGLSKTVANGRRFCHAVIGRRKERRELYITESPLCTSLYKPNEELAGCFNNLDAMRLKSTVEVDTIGLDEFAEQEKIGLVDFVKSDIQGADWEAFESGWGVLRGAVFIVSETLFSPIYYDVPLFGDVCAELMLQGFYFYRLIGPCGRTLKDIVLNNNKNYPSCQMWGDAIFVRNPLMWDDLTDAQFLKLAVLADMYGVPDVAGTSLLMYDKRKGTKLWTHYSGQWGK